jgi:hypothetical protein
VVDEDDDAIGADGRRFGQAQLLRADPVSVFTSSPLPLTRMSPPSCAFSLATWPATSSAITVVLFHVGSPSVVEATYFGMVLNLSANSPSLDGQAAAKPW